MIHENFGENVLAVTFLGLYAEKTRFLVSLFGQLDVFGACSSLIAHSLKEYNNLVSHLCSPSLIHLTTPPPPSSPSLAECLLFLHRTKHSAVKLKVHHQK